MVGCQNLENAAATLSFWGQGKVSREASVMSCSLLMAGPVPNPQFRKESHFLKTGQPELG